MRQAIYKALIELRVFCEAQQAQISEQGLQITISRMRAKFVDGAFKRKSVVMICCKVRPPSYFRQYILKIPMLLQNLVRLFAVIAKVL